MKSLPKQQIYESFKQKILDLPYNLTIIFSYIGITFLHQIRMSAWYYFHILSILFLHSNKWNILASILSQAVSLLSNSTCNNLWTNY